MYTSAPRRKVRPRLGKSSSRALRGEEEIKTKIDLSNISRPGDVLKAITQRKEAVAPAAPRPTTCRRSACSGGEACSGCASGDEASGDASGGIGGCATGGSGCSGAPGRCASGSIVTGSRAVSAAGAPGDTAPGGTGSGRRSSSGGFGERSARGSDCGASGCSSLPPPVPRMIVPQTGPRPVYKAPLRTAPPPVQPGVPIGGASRPVPGRPVPGQPIFQRRPPVAGGAPGAPRPPLRPGERRPMHPTRQSPAGARPLGVGPALPPPGTTRPGSRPGGPARRPGSALCSARREGRPDEGLHAAAAHGGVE